MLPSKIRIVIEEKLFKFRPTLFIMEFTNIEHLNNLIENKIKENTNLEYKDPRALDNNDKIVRSISAMANSNGGIIIYGLCDTNKDQAPEKIEWITDASKEETIQQILHSRITPKIDVDVSTIENPDNKEEFVIIIQVPKSNIAPHQDSLNKDEKRYWRRRGSIITQMEHYEVEDLFFKRKKPILKISLEKRSDYHDIILRNEGKVIAEKVFLKLDVPLNFRASGEKYWKPQGRGCNPTTHIYQYFNKEMPIFPDIPLNIGRLYTSDNSRRNDIEKVQIVFFMTCEDAQLKTGAIVINYEDPQEAIYIEEQKLPIPFCQFANGLYA